MKKKNVFKLMIIGILVLISCSSLFAQKQNKTLNIAIWSDVHLMSPALLDGPGGNAASRFDKMLYESDALFDAAFEMLKQRTEVPDMLLLPGDLTSDGEKASHELLAQKLAQVKTYFPGIKIYVIDGNHDVNRSCCAKTYANGYAEPTEWVNDSAFRAIYTGLGYGDPQNEYYVPSVGDYGVNSYVAYPEEGVTLIVIDVDNHSDGVFTEELVEWVIEKAQQANERGDAIIGMMHHGLVPHLTVEPKYWGGYLVPNYESISHRLADAGIHWMFTGHMHANDIAGVTTEAGNTLYDIETGSLVTHPSPVRYVTFTVEYNDNIRTEKLESEVELIQSINYINPKTNTLVASLASYYLTNYMSEEQIIDVVMGHSVNNLVDDLMEAIDTVEYSPDGGVTVHTGSRAFLEKLLGGDIADYLPTLFSSVLPTTEADGLKVDVSGNTLTIWRDDAAQRIKISGKVLASGVSAITDANIATYLLTPAFQKLDADYLQNSTYMHALGDQIIHEIGNYPLQTSDGTNDLLEAAFLVYLGHLAGEEEPSIWVVDILDGLKDGSVTDTLINHVLQVVMAEITNNILPNIPVNANNLITHESGSPLFTIAIKAGLAIAMNNMGSLMSTMGIDINTIAGDALNSSVVPQEYKDEIGGLIIEIMESLMYDTNHLEDNFTTIVMTSEFDNCQDTYTGVDFDEVYDNQNNVTGDLRVAVWSDVHVLPDTLIGGNTQSPEFLQAMASDRKMFAESAAILDAAVEQVKIDAPEVLIIPGDLTKDGEMLSHQYLATKLNEVKAALPNIKIYVINGNHDVTPGNYSSRSIDYSTTPPSTTPTVSQADFKNIYTGFGYGDSTNEYYTPPAGKKAGGLSYVAHPKKGFTFIAIDAGKYSADAAPGPGASGHITPDLMNWVVEKVTEAKEKGDLVFAMVHQGLVPHFSLEPVFLAEYLTDNYQDDAQTLADAGLRYVFTGHMHANDIASVTTDHGNTLYDIETGSLVTYPSPTRLVGFSRDTIFRNDTQYVAESVSILTRMIKEIDYIDPATGTVITDLTKYGREHSVQPSMVVGLLQGTILNSLIGGLVTQIDTMTILTSEGNTDTGSLAMIESMLPIDSNDLGIMVTNMLASQLADTMSIDLSSTLPGTEIRIYFDSSQYQVVINVISPMIGSSYAYITAANLKAYMIDKAFLQLDTAYLQKSSFMNGLMNKILLTALTINLKNAIPCNDHTFMQAAMRAYLGHLGGEEFQPQWLSDIANGIDITKDGVAFNYILDETMKSVMETELPDILNGITVDLNDLVTGDPTIKLMLPLYFGSETPSINVLLSAFNMNMSDLSGALNSEAIPYQYKIQIGGMLVAATNSFLFDVSYVEDNITNMYWEGEVSAVTISTDDDTKGTVTGGGLYFINSIATIEAIPNTGYGFLRWNDGLTDNPRTITVVSDTTFTAIFDRMYTVTVLANDLARGIVSEDSIYFKDSIAIISATANADCRFLKWNDGVIDNPRTITVISDTNFTAIFDLMHSVTVSANEVSRGTLSGANTYPQDSIAIITATANADCRFLKWNDGVIDNPRTITVLSDTNFIAIFDLMHSVTVSANEASRGTVTGANTYPQDSIAIISATANAGYYFAQWNDGVIDNPRTLTVLSDTGFIAEFEAIMYHVTVTANDSTMGTVTGAGYYEENSVINIVATANASYRFAQWNDGMTTNPRTVTVLSDTEFVAVFESVIGITDVKASGVNVYPNPATDQINIILPENISQAVFILYDIQNRILIQQQIGKKGMVSVSNFAAGIYIYQIKTGTEIYQGKIVLR
jgi:3',5'-cyclic AMP phosphodiesterase CpdA